MLRIATLPLSVLLLTALNVSAAPAQAPADGPCYSVRPLPALPSGTRVFVSPTLVMHRDHFDATLTSGENAKAPAALPKSGVFMVYTDPATGHTTTIHPAASICAYPPGTALPANLNGVTPDLIMP